MSEPAHSIKATAEPATFVEALVQQVNEVNGAVAKFARIGEGIAALKERFGGLIFDVRTKDGMAAAKVARAEVRIPRLEVEKIRKEAKAPLLALGRGLDAEAARITEAIAAIEGPIHSQIVAEEQRIENERLAAVEKERSRVEAIKARIQQIHDLPRRAIGLTSKQVSELHSELRELKSHFDFQEFSEQSEAEFTKSSADLTALYTATMAREDEAERQRQQRLAFEKEQAEAIRVKVIQDRIDGIRRVALRAVGKDLTTIEALGDELQKLYHGSFDFAEFADEAREAYRDSGKEIERMALERSRSEANPPPVPVREEPPMSPALVEADDVPIPIPEGATHLVIRTVGCGGSGPEPGPAVERPWRPTCDQLVEAVAMHFGVQRDDARTWLIEFPYTEEV